MGVTEPYTEHDQIQGFRNLTVFNSCLIGCVMVDTRRQGAAQSDLGISDPESVRPPTHSPVP